MNYDLICILDLPVILSQNCCGFLDPQKRVWKRESGRMFNLEKLRSYCQEALGPFDGICGFSKDNSSYQDKTLFRFPLRTKESMLSSDFYTIDRLHSLLHTLKEEAQYLLIFLRSVCSIEICKITESNDTVSLFKVSVSERDYESRLSQQKQLVNCIESTFTGQALYSVRDIIKDVSRFNIEKVDSGTVSNYDWLVVNQIGSDDNDVMQLAEKQHILPWVGTAINLEDPTCISNGRIFCVLPLPVENQAPFHIHINGTFALSSNRRSLKWEAQERKGDEEGTWNKLLVKKCLPSCYFKLVSELMELLIDPSTVYSCWPDTKRIEGTPWSGILDPFYQLLVSNSKAVHTSSVSGGTWISVSDAVFIMDEVPSAVNDAMIKCNVNLVAINVSCSETLKQYHSLKALQPDLVRSELKGNMLSYCNASRKEKLEILKYILKDDSFCDVIGLELLPLANGTFQQFKNQSVFVNDIFVTSSSYPISLLPGLESQLVSVYEEDSTLHSQLCSVVASGSTQLLLLDTKQVANLLSKCNTNHWSRDQLSQFWQWLHSQELSYFESKLIVSVKSHTGGTSVTALAKQDGIVYISPYNQVASAALLSGLEKCGIRFADARDFLYLKHSQLSQYLYQFENDQVLDAMHSLDLNSVSLSSTEAVVLQQFLSNSQLDHERLFTLCKISLFKALQYDESSRVSVNTMRSSYCDDKAIAMSGTYSFRTDLLTNLPLIIDVTGNDSSLVRNLSAHVYFMPETEYLQKVAFQQIHDRQFSKSSIAPFMISVLDNFYTPQYRQVAQQLTSAMSSLPFVEISNSVTLDSPQNLFDPEIEILCQLYNSESKFPAPSFHSYLPTLRQCGLKSSVSADEIFQILSSLRSSARHSNSYNADQIQYSRVVSVLQYLSNNSHLFNDYIKGCHDKFLDILRNEACHYCWLPVASNPPTNYPSSLTWKGSQYSTCLVSSGVSPLVVLSQDLSTSDLPLIVGSQAIFIENTPHQLSQIHISHPRDLVPAVISHFNQVISHKNEISEDMLQSISFHTYTYLQQNINYCNIQLFVDNWIWLESLSTFINSSQVAVAGNPSFRLSLEPFIFVLPLTLQKFSNLFIQCGVPDTVTASQILSVLTSIQDQSNSSQITNDDAWSMVKAILDWIADDTDRMKEGNVLIPIESDSFYPQLLPMDDVSYTDNEMLRDIANASDKEHNLIHPKLTYLVPILGITPLSDHLDITEDVFDDAGQHEPLTTRLCNILKDYKDDITIIKEMIQNADDAGATEVNILYDSRTHSTQKLLFKGMAESHGPALIVHNNSKFTKEDFENITKLAGATKANQPLKIGKFGVGFCSVYHITDIPSFVSGESLYIFDPTLRYLKGVVHDQSKPGKKIKYQQSKVFFNFQDLVPYEGLFGFSSLSDYEGTVFRFPFRTSMSQISSKVYDEDIVEHMKRDLVDCGSKLLLFLQHVKHITFSSRRGNEEMITEVSIDVSSSNSDDIQKIVIRSPHYGSITEHWLIASQEGQSQHENIMKPAVASVACQLDKRNSSYYKLKEVKGDAFCFLPLAMPSTGLPVHVSANFAVMSNRSGIWTEVSSGTVNDPRVQWNKNLMEKTIPEAYCKLLQKLQAMHCSGTLLDYEFHILWPLAKHMKYPWVSLVPSLINLLSEQKLFYSASLNKWQTLEQSHFIPSPLFSIAGKCSVPEKALCILQLPVVSLPPDHMQELIKFSNSLCVLDEDDFTSCFLSNIASFNAQIHIRNEVIFCMLLVIAISEQINSNKYENVKSKIKKFPCIPCSPKGLNLKVANQLIDPVEFADMFDPDDAMFPSASVCQNNLVHHLLFEFGMMSEKLSMDIIIRSAETIESIIVIDKSKAMKRVKAILKYITSPVPDELKKMQFLPVLPKPQHYFIHWKGEGHMLLSPNELFCDSRSKARDTALIVGSQRAVLNTNSVSDGGCGIIRSRVIKLLEISSNPSFDEVLEHFNTLICSFKPSASNGHYELIDEMCHNIYTFLDESLDNVQSQSLLKYYNKPFIWTGKAFVCPRDVAVNWNYHDGPYLYKLPSMFSEKDKLLKCLEIKTTFNYEDILVAFETMYKDFASHKIPKKYQNIALSMILELNSVTINSSQVSDYTRDIILIDNSYTLRQVSQLSFNDSPWLRSGNESFVHSKLTREVALTLGVKPTCSRFLNKFAHHLQQSFLGVPFGQKEELTRRIRNILQEYPLDATFLKELLQNADDAKATKIRIILDKRQHKRKRVPSEKWGKELQGPALLVWNDKEFSDADLEGIQKLGLGSKRNDDESIGQFGIGFNVVYHLTDCPSFITRGNTLCVFDPHCKYVPEADYSCPGRRYNIDDIFLEGMSDLQSSFLRVSSSNIHLPDNLTTGTLFRFPLRTQSGFQSTELLDKTTHLSVNVMERKLTEWVKEIEDALLFLNHIKKFSFYIIDDRHSSLKLSYEINISQEDQQRREGFHQKLLSFKTSKEPFIVTYPIQLSIIKPHNEEVIKRWLVQNGVGNVSKSPEEQLSLDRVQPKYGIAAPLDGNTHTHGRVFCFLPLPVFTNLPVHVNGQFALNDSRRSLWNGDKKDNKMKWNRFILQAIAYCYALLLDKARSYFISESETYSSQDVSFTFNSYYNLFPLFDKGGDSRRLEGDWYILALNVLQHLYDSNTSVLAIEVPTSQNKVKVEWHPLKSDDRFTQVYFQPEHVESIISVLNKIQMSVTCAPHSIYQTFNKVFDHPIVSPVSVFSFYTNFSSLILTSGVPVKLQESPFQTTQCFQDFLKYILCDSSEFPKSPIGYPLLLTSDDILRNFNENDQVLFSNYFSLFSKSKDKFVHPKLFTISLSQHYFLSTSSSSLFSQISKILDDNLPSKLKGDEAPSDVIDDHTLKKLWECITTDDYFIVYQNEIVQKWALLPSRNSKLYSKSSGILPIVEPDMLDDAFNVLKDLNVPILKSEGYPKAIFDYCPIMTQYDSILDVIFHVCRQNELCFTQKVTTLKDSQIQVIMSFLNKTSFHNDKEILDKILCLPLFKSINGTVTKLLEKHVYLWPDDPQFPLETHDKWAPIDRIVFLERDGSWKCLCQNNFFLLGQELSPTEVYCDMIFPVFDKLDFDERMCHMEYIRKSLFPNLKHALKMTGEQSEQAKKFVDCAKKLPFLVSDSNDDKLYPVNHFVDHTVDIFNSFPDKFSFLVEEYRSKEWLEFLKFIGLRTKVALEEFIEFCDQVSQNHCKDTSGVLVEYLFSTKATDIHKSPELLSTISEIPFVCTADLSLLSWIASPLDNTGFTCFNGAVSYDKLNASLLWTVKPIIQLPAYCMSVIENDVLNQLRVVSEPSATDIFKNIENISRSPLANFELMSTYTVSRTSDSTSVVEVIKNNIAFIHDHNSSLLKELSLVPFIPVSAEPNDVLEVSKPVLVNSMQVVMSVNLSESQKSTGFCPYINALPVSLHHLLPALSKAGVTYKVELKHIQYMLERLHQQCQVISNPNDEELVKNAMKTLSDLLKDVTQETEEILEPLYLPSIDDELVLSTKLVYRDRKVYYTHKSEWDFSESQFKLFHIPLSDNELSEKELCCKLPKKLSPKRLSSVSHNKLESGTVSQSHSKICERLKCLTDLCSVSFCSDGLTEMIINVVPDLSQSNASLIVNFIKNLRFKTLTDFTACVMINSIKVGILKAQFLFICDEDENYTLYSSDEVTISIKLRKSFAHELCNVVAQVVRNEAIKSKELNELIYKLLDVQNEEDFKSVMEEYDQDVNIDNECLISADDSKPEPGQPMAIYWKSLIDHNVNNVFRPQEWVGYERSDDDFIWAIILHEVQQEDVNNHFSRKFVIQIDNEDEIHEEIVSISCLYKLVRREAPVSSTHHQEAPMSPNHHQEAPVSPHHHQEVVPLPHSGIQDTSEARVETQDNELYRLKKEICEQLRLLWRLPDTEKRRGVRRLYLQYHPDKADPSKVSIYEEVFKFLKCQINRLENNLPLLDPDVTQSYSHHTGTSFESHWMSNFNQWDKSARNRRYRHSGKGGGGGSSFGDSNFSRPQQSHTTQNSGSSFSFQPQVDIIEAKRWMRQAKSDLQAMKDLFSSSKEEVSSQVIFMAHQVMEKALKAGMYALLGLNEIHLKRHELIVLARALSSCEGSLSELNNLVSNMEQYYLDTRYPNRHTRPDAPVDIYSLQQASDITKRSDKVYGLISILVE